jgi:hypothetical protein
MLKEPVTWYLGQFLLRFSMAFELRFQPEIKRSMEINSIAVSRQVVYVPD